MAYLYNAGKEEGQREFIVQSVSDIAKLPTSTTEGDKSVAVGETYKKVAFGSKALCVENGKVYVLTPSNEWTKVGG